MKELESLNVLVTGAYGHFGRHICAHLAEQGANVLLSGRNLQKLEDLKSELDKKKLKSEIAEFDVCDERQVESFVNKYSHLELHGLVNNAYFGPGGTVRTATPQDYRNAYEVGVVAPANLIKLLLPSMEKASQKNGYASVVNVSSMYGSVSPKLSIYKDAPSSNPPFYGACKAALIQLTRYAAIEFAPKNIRVNSIAPGPFPSDKVQSSDPDFIHRLEARVPMGRIGDPREICGAISFLLSRSSSYITGVNLPVDGGWTAW